MFKKLLTAVVGSSNERRLKAYRKRVVEVNEFEESLAVLNSADLRVHFEGLKARHEAGESLDSLLAEVFAVVREAGRRALQMRHFDVQLMGGMALFDGKIIEMGTGEGKTLIATLPAVLASLSGRSVHVVTINDYLAKRDAEWMQPLYAMLGLTVGFVVAGQDKAEKKASYACDVIYATNNELGFDYLRDRMSLSLDEQVQPDLYHAIVDEVDSILIDEARTPLIISGQVEDNTELFKSMNQLVPKLVVQNDPEGSGDFTVDEKSRQVLLTDDGHDRVEKLLNQMGLLEKADSLYHAHNMPLLHVIQASLKAHTVFKRDVDYLVHNGEVVIVDEHTGRAMPGRRWSDGIHQAVEAKEGVEIKRENQTLASITFQNFFRLYEKLSGMTGTADTEAYEFHQIYNLDVVVIPPNKPVQRVDHQDVIYLRQQEKFDAIIREIQECVERQQPVLVGTISIETSEFLSGLLKKQGIAHQVLNAKYHEQEAEIVAEAGRPGQVTIATNMAGRGTDIVLGGNLNAQLNALTTKNKSDIEQVRGAWQVAHDQVKAAGGLHIIGTERHESRRIDNQLRGRAGRQGDPGSSRFYMSLEDNLMRIFGSDRMQGFMEKLGMQPDEPVEHKWINRAIENAQRKVEGHHFDIRKQLLEYDNVANDQRQVIYQQRDVLLTADNLSLTIAQMRHDVVRDLVNEFMPADTLPDLWDTAALSQKLSQGFGLEADVADWLQADIHLTPDGVIEKLQTLADEVYQAKMADIPENIRHEIEKNLTLQTLDRHWREHLQAMTHLRQAIGLRGYAQKDPKQEYKRESFEMFKALLNNVKREVIEQLMRLSFVRPEDQADFIHESPDSFEESDTLAAIESLSQAAVSNGIASDASANNQEAPRGPAPKIGRNDPCHCGSGLKYKNCHGKLV